MNETKPALTRNGRILIVDDNAAIHEDFRKMFAAKGASACDVDRAAAELFDQEAPPLPGPEFEIDFAFQGAEALEKVHAAQAVGRPYALAFVDMRMPPGWDGLTTITRLWEADPQIQIVICTACTDRSWTEIQAVLNSRAGWLVLKKPFDQVELTQIVHVLVEKWNLARRDAPQT